MQVLCSPVICMLPSHTTSNINNTGDHQRNTHQNFNCALRDLGLNGKRLKE